MSTQDSSAVAVARAHVDAWSNHDYDRARAGLAPDVHAVSISVDPEAPEVDLSGIEVMQLDFEPVWIALDPPRYFRIELVWRLGADEELIDSFRSAASSVTQRERGATGTESS